MFLTIVIAVLFLAGVILLIIGAFAKDPDNDIDLPAKTLSLGSGIFLVLIGVVIWLFASFTIVKATEVGIPVTFGKVGAPLTSGTHWVKPWTSVEKYPIRPLTTEQQVDVRTSEGGKVTAKVAARWVVNEAKAATTYKEVRTGDDEEIQQKIVDPNLRQAVNEVYAAKTNVDAANDRTTAPVLILAKAKALLAPYGIDITTVLLRQVDPDDKTGAAVAAFAAEQQKTRIAEQATKTASEQAKANLATAQGLKAAAAELPNLTPEQALQVCAQAWERQAEKATEARVPLYTAPCGGSSVPVAGGGATK